MCGIAGVMLYKAGASIDPAMLGVMGSCIAHRGPDDSGIYIDETRRIGLVHRRLSIIDLTSGHQPMANDARTLWIVFNGEIYNFPELRRELERDGHQFHTHSDTEVILQLYDQLGERAFARLNGIFALAIYDTRTRTLVLARDPFGVKPLYFTDRGGRLVFGSEIKAILAADAQAPAVAIEALDAFLTLRFNPSPQTLFSGVSKLAPGHYLKVSADGAVMTEAYEPTQPPERSRATLPEAVGEYRRLLEQAVRRQLLSDVPVGLLLSGGLDSATIGHLMAQASTTPVQSFSVGFEGRGDYNELADARHTAKLIGSDHHEMVLSQGDYLRFFPQSFYHTEEPIAETTIPALWYVARLAANHVKVVLAGQGADELLAGYRRYLGARYLGALGPLLANRTARALVAQLPRSAALKRACYAAGFPTEQGKLLGMLSIFTEQQRNYLYNAATSARVSRAGTELIERQYHAAGDLDDTLGKLLHIDTRLGLADDLLLFNDKMTMANALEMRVPYLDRDLVRFVESLPSSYKLRRTTRKFLLKAAALTWLPKSTVRRKKRGFATPMDEWLQSSLADEAHRLLLAGGSACRAYFRPEAIEGMLNAHRARREDYRVHLFALICFEIWHRTFLGNLPVPDWSHINAN